MEISNQADGFLCRPAHIDEGFEFSAPRFFDFLAGETEDDARKAQLWFEVPRGYAPSPFTFGIKTGRPARTEESSKFQEMKFQPAEMAARRLDDEIMNTEEYESTEQNFVNSVAMQKDLLAEPATRDVIEEAPKEEEFVPQINESKTHDETIFNSDSIMSSVYSSTSVGVTVTEAPTLQKAPSKMKEAANISQNSTVKSGYLKARNMNIPSVPQPAKCAKATTTRATVSNGKSSLGYNAAQENQAIKRQKLDGGKTRQILNPKEHVLPHKSKDGVVSDKNLKAAAGKSRREKKYEIINKKDVNPFVSTAEMINKFHAGTRRLDVPAGNRSLSHDDCGSVALGKSKLTLTRPKEPEFRTSHRVRPVKVKSSAELEDEMLAKMPKFKARPVNKKILEAPTLPLPQRSIPQMPEFQEFHLRTMDRGLQHGPSTANAEHPNQEKHKIEHHGLTQPRSPHLETAARARPAIVKSSFELEQEELEKVPKFKARPLNKKILKSKGGIGVFRNPKPQVTIPKEFHFAIDERLPPSAPVVDMFDKLSLTSEDNDKRFPRLTAPTPFHLQTEERGMEKERRFTQELIQKQLQEQKARIPKASPYPYTTDYPVIPPKPQPKECTKPEGFKLLSIVRHEEEMQRLDDERRRKEREEAEMKEFRAQPILTSDPIPLPERVRRPLTEVQEFVLHVDHRAEERSEFDKKLKQKEAMYKRHREEQEVVKSMEEEKALKQMRRMMVPHARPLPNFNQPFLPERSSKPLTMPKSPCLLVSQRRVREDVPFTASAFGMR